MSIYTRRHQTDGFKHKERPLTAAEQDLIRRVFKSATLPALSSIQITNELSPIRTPFTIKSLGGGYYIHVGEYLYEYLMSGNNTATLVHEMTHVWQYHVGSLTSLHALSAHLHYGIRGRTDDLYVYDIHKDSWNDMGFEGQAQLVEDWFSPVDYEHKDGDSMSETSDRFVFVKKILYGGDVVARELTLDELRIPLDQPAPSEIQLPDRHVAPDDAPPLMSESALLDILKRRYYPNDIKGLAARVSTLEDYFGWLRRQRPSDAQAVTVRLQVRHPGDQLSEAFYDNLSRPTIKQLLNVLQGLK